MTEFYHKFTLYRQFFINGLFLMFCFTVFCVLVCFLVN